MNPDQEPPTLAAQAAAWVPPWQRPTEPKAPDEPVVLVAETASDEPVVPEDEAGPEEPAVPEERSDLGEYTTDARVADAPAWDGDTADLRVIDVSATVDRLEDGAAEVPAPEISGGNDAGESAAGDRTADVPADEGGVGAGVSPAVAGSELGPPADLPAALEAILLVVDVPVADEQLASVLDVPVAEVTGHLVALAAEYTAHGRGFDLRRAAGGWRLYTRPEYAGYVERFVLDGQSLRLTQAALETLAVIAYQQPVTRSRISGIRGVNCDGVVRTLVTRGLIEECGTQPESGAFLYRTTALFLEKLGLDSVDELPPLAPFLPDDVNGFADAQR